MQFTCNLLFCHQLHSLQMQSDFKTIPTEYEQQVNYSKIINKVQ